MTAGKQVDVVIVGGGVAGVAASIHLARGGMSVVCLEGRAAAGDAVGESLDWSAPDLLAELGLSAQYLIERGVATSKRHVILRLPNGAERHYVPGAWLGDRPYNVRLDTLHVNRSALDAEIREIARAAGVELLAARVTRVEQTGGRVQAVYAEDGECYAAPWFLDASGGSARLFARAFHIGSREYGPAKVAMWRHVDTDSYVEGTTLYGSAGTDGYMEWAWQIPIQPGRVSLGCVFTGDRVKQMRQAGMEPGDIYRLRLARYTALRPFAEDENPPRVTSFRCRVHDSASGPNWFMLGEAAAMVDPMTSNGVTAALRQAREASRLVLRYRTRYAIPWRARKAYDLRLGSLARFFNTTVERVMYEGTIRDRLGALAAGNAYTIPAWLMNLFYARLQPRSLPASACFGVALASIASAANVVSWCCRCTQRASVAHAEQI